MRIWDCNWRTNCIVDATSVPVLTMSVGLRIWILYSKHPQNAGNSISRIRTLPGKSNTLYLALSSWWSSLFTWNLVSIPGGSNRQPPNHQLYFIFVILNIENIISSILSTTQLVQSWLKSKRHGMSMSLIHSLLLDGCIRMTQSKLPKIEWPKKVSIPYS